MEIRLILYAVGAWASGAMAAKFFGLRDWTARLMGFLMVGWLVSCLTLGALALNAIYTGEVSPVWRSGVMNVNAVLQALCPTVALLFFGRANGRRS